MWQLWQVGAAAVSGRTPFCFSRYRTPCLEEEYISHWGWSMPMWQVWQAWGCWASFLEKSVPGVAGIAGGNPELAPLLSQFLDLDVRLDADLVAAAAALHAVHQGHGLHVEGGHGLHGGPGLGVLAVLELLDLGSVAVGAALGRRDLGQGDRLGGEVLVPVADGAVDALLAVLAELPVRHDSGCHGRVTDDAEFRRRNRLLFRWVIGLDPVIPTARQGVDLGVTALVKFNRPPGGRVLLRSGSVEDVGLVLFG